MKTLSLITNFGCKNDCKYCITRQKYPEFYKNQKFNLKNLPLYIETGKYNKISVSGGGDPLRNYSNTYHYFWNNLFRICDFFEIKLDLHTSYYSEINTFVNSVLEYSPSILNKIVLHLITSGENKNTLFDMFDNIPKFPVHYSIRFALVISNNITIEYMKLFENVLNNYFHEDYLANNKVEIAYRELYVGENSSLIPNKEVLEYAKKVNKRFKTGRFVNQADYNDYMWPDGTITNTFIK